MDFLLRNLVIFAIAPCVGAWIEVKNIMSSLFPVRIAPCVGAWIEKRHTAFSLL